MGSSISPAEYLRRRIGILESQISQIDAEIESRRKDHERIMTAFADAKQSYTSALYDEYALQEFSLGKDYTERKQRMHQIIRGVNTGIFDEVRTYKAFLKSLNSERRSVSKEMNLLSLKLQMLEEQ